MLIDTYEENDRKIVQIVEKRLDAASAIEFKDLMQTEIESGKKHLVIDLAMVDFIDSSGLGALVSVLKSVASDGSLSLTGLRKKPEQIFKLTRMDTVFQIFPTVTEALEAA